MLDAPEAIPGRYSAAIAIMQSTGWSWAELMATPADLVDELLIRMEYTAHWSVEREKLERARRNAEASRHGR